MKNSYFAVVGNPIDHSLSPVIHQVFAQQTGQILTYDKINVAQTSFKSWVEDFFSEGGKGLNITQPYKEQAFLLADQATPRCVRAQAANTLWHGSKGVYADNTDGIGLLRDLARYLVLTNKRVLLLGAGGAARGVLPVLIDAGPIEIVVANRSIDKANQLCKTFPQAVSSSLSALHGSFDLVINATSSSLFDQQLDLSSDIILPTTFCYDLAYSIQSTTPFVAWARQHGCLAVDGLGMLIEQAAEAFCIWHGIMPDTSLIQQTVFNREGL